MKVFIFKVKDYEGNEHCFNIKSNTFAKALVKLTAAYNNAGFPEESHFVDFSFVREIEVI